MRCETTVVSSSFSASVSIWERKRELVPHRKSLDVRHNNTQTANNLWIWATEQREWGFPTLQYNPKRIRNARDPHYFTAFSIVRHKLHHLHNFAEKLTLSISQLFFISTLLRGYILHTRLSVLHWWYKTPAVWQINEPSVLSKKAGVGVCAVGQNFKMLRCFKCILLVPEDGAGSLTIQSLTHRYYENAFGW